MRKVKEHGVTLPEKYVGFLLVNALQLSEGDIKALLNYSRGSISPVDVRDWIRKHETKLQLAHVGVDRKSGSTSTKSSTASANYIVNEPYDPEIEEEINMVEDALRDLQGDEDEDGEGLGDGTGSGLESILEEHEAAEVLSTILQQKKKTYQQTVKAKKSKELSRGYGKGRGKSLSVTGTGVPPFREGQFKMTIEQLKKVTKCGICHKVGHWHRECPERGQPSLKETHHLETEEAIFCGHLEHARSAEGDLTAGEVLCTEPGLATSATQAGNLKGDGSPSNAAYRADLHDDMSCFEVYFGSGHGTADEIHGKPQTHQQACNWDDATCATLDTGCQRMAIGRRTLEKLAEQLPPGLSVCTKKQEHRFKSVHGKSNTQFVACVPTCIGKKGSYFMPAVFDNPESVNAPFLIGLPFLLSWSWILFEDRGLISRS
jgi:hypothetical protein